MTDTLVLTSPDVLSGRITDADVALKFMLAGNAYFTVRSQRTGTRYTFRVSQNKANEKNGWKPMYFVALLGCPACIELKNAMKAGEQ